LDRRFSNRPYGAFSIWIFLLVNPHSALHNPQFF
jgi:hypothetical protein